jgi:hypothetical protein
VGRSHKQNGIPLQDYGKVETSPFPILIVADGAGSAANSSTGAQTVVETAFDFITKNKIKFDVQQYCWQLFDTVLSALDQKASEMQADVSSLASTLIIVFILEDVIYWMQLGDGYIVVRKNGILGCVSIPYRGEFANETIFITSANAKNELLFGAISVRQCEGIIAFTDGLDPILINKDKAFPAPVCSSLINQILEKPLTVDDLNYLLENQFSTASHDDKTIGFLVSITEQGI